MKGLNRLMMVVFLSCLLLQWNDPDPVIWTLIYSAPIAGCLLWERSALGRLLPGVTALLAVAFALTLVFSAPLASTSGLGFTSWQMMDEHAEVAREAGGLALIAGWMAVLAFVGSKQK